MCSYKHEAAILYIYIVLHANAKTAFETDKTTITTTIFWIKNGKETTTNEN